MPSAVYLDYNATTPLLPEVRALMERALADGWGNPSSHHWAGRTSKRLLDEGRAGVAAAIGASVAEIVFNSGATESDNHAIRGICSGKPDTAAPRDTIVLTSVEHPAVRAAADECASRGWRVVTVPVLPTGALDMAALARAIDTRTKLVVAMAVNNETGVIFPVAEIGRLAREAGALFFCDAVQALGKIPINVEAWRVDLLCVAAHKAGGPKGIGALYVRRGVNPAALVLGGSQERDRRAGTENVAAIAGFGLAASLAESRREANMAAAGRLRDRLERELPLRVSGVAVHGAGAPRVANTSYVSFDGAIGENLLLAFDLEGIAVSGGSACASGALHPSRTLEAMGVSADVALGAVRFTFGPGSTEADVDRVLDIAPRIVERSRAAARVATAKAGGA